MTVHRCRHGVSALLAIGALAIASGCTSAYRFAGNRMIGFGESELVPYLLTYDDTAMACAAGEALTPALMSFEAVGSDPDQLAIMVFLGAGLCAEERALDHELRYLRAVLQRNANEAQDARVAQKRAHQLAASRQYIAYQRFSRYYGEVGDGQCSRRLGSDFDQLMYLTGLVAGLQALLNDGQAEQAVGVSRDIAAKAERAAACLDSDKWWGVPLGLRAAIWNIIPGTAPANADPMKTLALVARQGERQGVRLGHALWAVSAMGSGNRELTKSILRDFAATARTVKLDPKFKMLDAIGEHMLLSVSDRMWTEAIGSRTPMGGLGTFWDDQPGKTGDIDDLL